MIVVDNTPEYRRIAVSAKGLRITLRAEDWDRLIDQANTLSMDGWELFQVIEQYHEGHLIGLHGILKRQASGSR